MFADSLIGVCRQVLLVGCAYCAFVQQVKVDWPSQQPQKTSQLAYQIDRVQDNILKEDVGLSLDERVSLYANLARIWKDQDPKLSIKFLRTAVDQSLPSLTDNPNDRNEKLRSLRKLLILSGQVDAQTTDDIVKALKSEGASENRNRQQNSIALTEAALALVASNPSAAAGLAVAALNYLDKPSQNEKIYHVLLSLAARDKKLAEDLYRRILKFAQSTSDAQSIATLALFTSSKSHTVQVDFLSDRSKTEVLDIFLQILTQISARFEQKQMLPEEREENCKLFLIGSGLRETFNSYLLDKPQLISQALGGSLICHQASTSAGTQSLFDVLSTQAKDQTTEELLKSARNSSDHIKKSFYFSVVIGRLSRDRNFEEVIEILDEMDEPSRKAMGGGDDLTYWTAMRVSNATSAVLQKLETQDFGAANKIIARTPADCRPQTGLQVSRSILSKATSIDSSRAEHVFAVDLIADERKKLPNLDPFLSVDLYLSLLRDFSSLLPDEAPLILRETIKAINKADTSKQNQSLTKDFAGALDLIPLPAVMLQNQELVLSEIQQVERRYTRVRLKLGLLKASMQEYLKEKRRESNSKTGPTIFQ